MNAPGNGLKKALGAMHLWGIGVGLVISGEYFGWNYGWAQAGTIGLLIAVILITVLYVTFIFSFTELTTSIPSAGGPFSYALKAFGPFGAIVAGYATLIEFLFATPAIAMALGSYVHFLHPAFSPQAVAVAAYLVFTAINLLGIKEAAWFSLVITVLAIIELVVFFGITAPHFKLQTFLYNPLPFGVKGIFAALPFAIWLYVCLEGIAMVAEEVKGGKSTIAKGYISALLTLAVLAFGVMFCVGGVAHWDKLSGLDYPLPESIALVLGRDNQLTQVFTGIGLFGLVASFHGIIITYSRQLFALARAGYLPGAISVVGKKRGVPYMALIAGSAFGMVAIFLLNTSDLVVLSTIGAVVLYGVSMLSLFKLRRSEPNLERPYKAPFYPLFPAIALLVALLALAAMVYLYQKLSGMFLGGLVVVALVFLLKRNFQIRNV